ncbi:MAG: ornithine cyclodeaminase family protein [Gemmatimonadota bacterium]
MADSLLYLSRADVEAVDLPMTEIIEAVEGAFREKALGRTEMPPKPGIHPSRDGFIHAMPAYLSGTGGAGLKWVSAFPENRGRDLPQITGLIVLNDATTGLPLAVMDCTWITATRTAAASAVAARHLARPDATSVGIVACGVQGRTHLEALACLFGIERVHAYDHRRSNTERYKAEMEARLGLPITIVERAEDAVRDLDLVVTSGPIRKEPEPVIEADWLAPGAFASAVDFDSYWTGPAMAQMDVIATDDRAQMEYFRGLGYFKSTPAPHTELAELVSDAHPGRTDARQRTLAINLGLAIEDIVTAQRVVGRARERGIGVELPL